MTEVTRGIVGVYQRSNIALYTVVVPKQDFAAGVLNVRVIEGYVSEVVLGGGSSVAQERLARKYLEPLVGKKPLPRESLQRSLSFAREIPGLTSEFKLVPSQVNGGVSLESKLSDAPVQVGFAVNSRGTNYLGRTQVTAHIYLNNILAAGGQTRLTFAAPTDLRRFQYYAASHSQFIGTSGATVQVSGAYLETHPQGLSLRGRATTPGVQFTQPLKRTFTQSIYVSAELDAPNARSVFFGTRYADERSRALRVAASYSRVTSGMTASFTSAASLGVNGLGARTLTPMGAELGFVKVNARASLATRLTPVIWVRLTGISQWSPDRLPAGEQLALGGNEFGRAYQAAVVAGDRGYAGSAELALQAPMNTATLREPEAYGFLDGGKVFYKGRGGLPTAAAHIKSAGFGLRSGFGRHIAI